jgi:RNA polymerase sigma-70 factor (ECF subfamily)
MTITSTERNRLITDCINGNRKRQKELYDLLAPSLYTICLRYAKSQVDAEDILQNGFIKIFTNLHKFRGEGSFEGWVRRIIVNTAIEQLRDKKPNLDIDLIEQNSLPVIRTSSLDKLYEKDLIQLTNMLSDGYRIVFYLYAILGYSHKEIGAYLNITESTSKSQYSRAKALLRSAILKGEANSRIFQSAA